MKKERKLIFMLCQNCGKNEVNFKYTQVINGVKKEMALCDRCARELGIDAIDYSMTFNFSSFSLCVNTKQLGSNMSPTQQKKTLSTLHFFTCSK